jgi:hypothetical protein
VSYLPIRSLSTQQKPAVAGHKLRITPERADNLVWELLRSLTSAMSYPGLTRGRRASERHAALLEQWIAFVAEWRKRLGDASQVEPSSESSNEAQEKTQDPT